MLKRKNLTIPFYMDPWFWVKLMVFVIFLLFLVWPFSSIIINAFKSSKVEGFTMANFQKFFAKKYYYGALKNSVMVSVVPSLFAIILGVLIVLFHALNMKVHVVKPAVLDGSFIYTGLKDLTCQVFPFFKKLLVP